MEIQTSMNEVKTLKEFKNSVKNSLMNIMKKDYTQS